MSLCNSSQQSIYSERTEVKPVNGRLISEQYFHFSVSDAFCVGEMSEIGEFVDEKDGAEVAGQLQPLFMRE